MTDGRRRPGRAAWLAGVGLAAGGLSAWDARAMPSADLVARSPAPATPVGYRGRPLAVRFELVNRGAAPAVGFSVGLYLSDNPLISAVSDPRIGLVEALRLQPGETRRFTATATVPEAVAAGAYYLGVIANADQAVPEARLDNNVARSSQPFEVRDPQPDFASLDVRSGPEAGAGEPLAVTRTLANLGNRAGRVTYALILSRDGAFDPGDARLLTGEVALAAGEQSTGTDRPPVPSATAPGVYRLLCVVDPDGAVVELSEGNNVGAAAVPVTVYAGGPTIRPDRLPPAFVGYAYRLQLVAAGADEDQGWAIVQGALPPGIVLDAATGALGGVPTSTGASAFTVRAGAAVAARTLEVRVPGGPLEILTRAVPLGFVARPYRYPLTAFGGRGALRWSAASGLPAGWHLDETGVLAGTATAPAVRVLVARVDDEDGSSAEASIPVRVVVDDASVRFGAAPLPDGRLDEPYDRALSVEGGVAPYVIALVAGAVPDGLRLSDDRLVGVPTRVGTYSFALRVSDRLGDFDVNRFVVEIGEGGGVGLLTTGLPTGVVGAEYLDEAGRPPRIRALGTAQIRLVDGRLPPGLRLDPDGVVAGRPTEAGLYPFTAEAVDAAGQTARRAFGVAVDASPSPPPPGGGCRCARPARRDGSRGGAVALVLVALAALGRRRGPRKTPGRRAVAILAGLSALTVTTGARGQAGAGYYTELRTEAYVRRTGGAQVIFSDANDGFATVDLPFDFDFFGQIFRRMTVSANGYVTFLGTGTEWQNRPLPDPAPPNAMIAVVWDDLEGNLASWHVDGVAPNRVAILQYALSSRRGQRAGGRPQAQLWLHEAGVGRFELRYGGVEGMTDPGAWSATLGFEDATGTQGRSTLSCGAGCGGNDLASLADRVWRADRDAGPELVAEAVDAPVRIDPGLPASLTLRVRSLHGAALGPVRWVVRAPGLPGVSLGRGTVRLGPFERRTVTATVTVPLSLDPTTLRLTATVDADDAVAEIDETNNVATAERPTAVAARAPDFVAAAVEGVAPTVAVQGIASGRVTVRNRGNQAGAAQVRLVWSSNPVPTAADPVAGARTLTLAPFTEASFTASWPATGLRPGAHYVGVVVDPDDAVVELDELNNARAAGPVRVVADALRIVARPPLPATAGQAYTHVLEAAGGDGDYAWRIAQGSLPAGLSLSPERGRITGRAERASESTVLVEVSSAGRTADATLAFTVVAPAAGLVILNRALLPGVVGAPYPPVASADALITTGGAPPVAFSATGVPAGLGLSGARLVGTPMAAGVFDVRVTATDAAGAVARRALALTVAPPGRLTLVADALPRAEVGRPYLFRFRALAATSEAVFSGTGLPPGLAVAEDGQLDGTPNEVGRWSFVVTVIDGAGRDDARFSLDVDDGDGLRISPSLLPEAIVGREYAVTLDASGGTPPYAWTVEGDPLPEGLQARPVTVGATAGLFFGGTAQRPGLAALLVAVTDAAGRRAERPFAVRARSAGTAPGDAGGCRCASPRRRSGWLGWPWVFALLVAVGRKESGPKAKAFGVWS